MKDRSTEADARIVIDDLLRQAGWNPADKSQVLTEYSVYGTDRFSPNFIVSVPCNIYVIISDNLITYIFIIIMYAKFCCLYRSFCSAVFINR